MFLKPKMTYKHSRATLYRRFTNIETSNSLKTVYKTTADNLLWLFNADTKAFERLSVDFGNDYVVTLINGSTILQYGNVYYHYVAVQDEPNRWEETTDTENMTLLSAQYANIGRITTNKYYRVCSFDYILKGDIEGTTTQPIRGNITPLESFTIKHFNDSVNLAQDDLVVINKRLYSVENPTVDHKHLPNDYSIYTVTLNSVYGK